MKKGLFTAAVIAAMMMTQPVMAQEVVGQTEEIVAQTEETEQEDVPESPESDMAEEYEGTSDSQVRLTVFSGENNETPIVSADPTDKEVQQPEKKIGWQTEEGKTYYYDENGNEVSLQDAYRQKVYDPKSDHEQVLGEINTRGLTGWTVSVTGDTVTFRGSTEELQAPVRAAYQTKLQIIRLLLCLEPLLALAAWALIAANYPSHARNGKK